MSYFDHDLPDFSVDGLVVTANGTHSSPSRIHTASDFPAYWQPDTRQYTYYDGHNGYDFNLSYEPVFAAASGRVIYADWEYSYAPAHGYGQMVMIEHRSGYVTLYGHLSKFTVKKGQRVRAGQRIGVSGNTGHSTGPHLHFTVFHNCSPTDPYGWTGSDADPLANYKGESSTYLWLHQPAVTNPPAAWPGAADLPPASATRLILLRLPDTSRGTDEFTRRLRSEATRVMQLLPPSAVASVDLIDGAVRVDGMVSASQIYALPGVVSIGAPYIASDAHDDLLAALARAATVQSPTTRLVHVGGSRTWSGYVMTWNGRTILVGHGSAGTSVRVHLPGGSQSVMTARADPITGVYALDLGNLAPAERVRLLGSIQKKSPAASEVHAHSPRQASGKLRPHFGSVDSSESLALTIILGLIIGAIVFRAGHRSIGTGA